MECRSDEDHKQDTTLIEEAKTKYYKNLALGSRYTYLNDKSKPIPRIEEPVSLAIARKVDQKKLEKTPPGPRCQR